MPPLWRLNQLCCTSKQIEVTLWHFCLFFHLVHHSSTFFVLFLQVNPIEILTKSTTIVTMNLYLSNESKCSVLLKFLCPIPTWVAHFINMKAMDSAINQITFKVDTVSQQGHRYNAISLCALWTVEQFFAQKHYIIVLEENDPIGHYAIEIIRGCGNEVLEDYNSNTN